MASLIQGYNYDIFISYRQKDNKGDKWVSEFVDALKDELESTFKDEISVYFDINTHDGLLETHDVDESLKEKLKCLVFIPIISRTYCDPKSFAWEHEFIAFVEQASKDQHGLKVRLTGGNVASRVLPIQIHDIDNQDIKLCESVLDGVLRGIEFIYKEAGVNRPLGANEENPHDNLNHTIYRNQINKVANAIDQIITSLKKIQTVPAEEKTWSSEQLGKAKKEESLRNWEKHINQNRIKLLSGVLITAIFIMAALLAYSKIFNRDKFKNLKDSNGRISIAVMPFKNLAVDTTFNIWQLGLQNLLITSLSNSDGLSVRQYESMEKLFLSSEPTDYASITPTFASNIALKLEANTVIIGNIYKTGNRIRVTANLMDSRSEEIFKSYEIDGNKEDDFFHITDSLSKLITNFLEIKILKQEYSNYDLKNVYTSSAEAFKYFIQGRTFHGKLDYSSAIELYTKSINIDTNFVCPMLMLSYVYGDIEKSEESKKWAYEAYNRINSVPHDVQLQIMEVKAAIDKEPKELIKYLKQYLEINPYSTRSYYAIGWASYNTEQWQDAIDAFEKGIEIIKSFNSNYKLWIWNYLLLGDAYHKIGEHDKEMKTYEVGLNLWPSEEPLIVLSQSVCALSQGDTVISNKYLKKIKTIGQREGWSESTILYWLANIHYQANLFNKAEELYRRALSLNHQNPALKNDLAFLLIKNDIDINEGIDLITQVLKVTPNNYDYLYTYGLGLFKQGKVEKALEYQNKSWELRPFYDHEAFLHLEEVKKAIASQESN